MNGIEALAHTYSNSDKAMAAGRTICEHLRSHGRETWPSAVPIHPGMNVICKLEIYLGKDANPRHDTDVNRSRWPDGLEDLLLNVEVEVPT